MRNRRYVLPVVLFLALAGALLVSAVSARQPFQQEAEVDQPQRTINVSGNGLVSTQPDIAVVRLGVQTEAEQAADALAQNSEQMQDLVDVLSESGIADEDIQTQTIRLSPRYENIPDEAGQRELVGYTAANIVEVYVREIDDVGEILDAAIQAGGNRIEGIRFEISDPSAYLDQARQAAWQDAQHKAEQLANLADSELDVVLSINETGQSPRPAVEQVARFEAASAVPIEVGSQTIEISLHVT